MSSIEQVSVVSPPLLTVVAEPKDVANASVGWEDSGLWPAFHDCILDLDWLPFQFGVVVLVYEADQVLLDAYPTDIGTLVGVLSATADEFGEAVAAGEWWDRDPVPFHVVLQGSRKKDFRRWRSAGAKWEPLSL